MADQDDTAQSEETGGKKKKKLMPILVGLAMVIEGAGVFAVMKIMGGPATVDASELVEEVDSQETPVEVMLLDARFQNLQTGRVWGWDAEIYIKVRNKNLEQVNEIQERHKAEIQAGVGLIFRRAQDRHLREPGLETLNRQLKVYVDEVFGHDTDDMPRIERVIIAELKGFPMDN